MAAGDTCTVFAGAYNEVVTIGAGTAGNYKTVSVNPGDTVNVLGFTINSHTKVVGFVITNPASPASRSCVDIVGNSTDWYITNNVMTACGNGGSMITEHLNFAGTSFGFIQGNTLSYGCSTSSAPNVCEGMLINGDHHLIENNDISHVSDGATMYCVYCVFRNNTQHDVNSNQPGECIPSTSGGNGSNCHIDFVESEPNTSGGTTRPGQFYLFENNHERNGIGSQSHVFLTQGDACGGACHNAIIRFNDLAHVGSYGLLDQMGGFTFVKSYNNSWVDLGNNGFGEGTSWHNSNSTNGSELNNLFYYPQTENNAPYMSDSGSATGYVAGSNLAFCTGTCTFRGRFDSGTFAADAPGNLVTNPLFIGYALNDFHLQAGSPAIGAGRNLTTVAASDTGVGTSLIVNDAGFFQDGYGLTGVQADWIRVGPTTTVQIASINYSANTITLANAISRSPGDPVYLYKNSSGKQVLYGSAPDIGAYPFGAAPPPPPTTSPCDVNGDGLTNVADVQVEVNMALGIIPCTNSSGVCTVVSVQRVVNAALGGSCVAP
jgi:hypothetical protein